MPWARSNLGHKEAVVAVRYTVVVVVAVEHVVAAPDLGTCLVPDPELLSPCAVCHSSNPSSGSSMGDMVGAERAATCS